MRELVAEALEHGAFGMSTGLEYAPGSFASKAEVTAVAAALRSSGRLFTSHMRNEGSHVKDSVEEIIDIGKTSDIPVHISHHNVVGRENRGLLSQTMERIKQARTCGVDISLDYCHFQPFYHPLPLDAIAPDWHHEPSYDAVKRKLLSAAGQAQIRAAYASGWKSDLEIVFPNAAWDYTIIWGPGIERLVGASIAELAELERREPLELCFALIEQASDRIIVSRVIHPDDTRAVLGFSDTMLSTDTYALDYALPEHITLHPRNYGAYPCFFRRYVREEEFLSLEEGVRRCTSLPARRFGLRDRGYLHPGMAADVVIFDPSKIADQATVTEPARPCEGVTMVIINGIVVANNGRRVADRAGKVLRA
jgi:N-acyl-D-aspartate/D-glutamate deacylase